MMTATENEIAVALNVGDISMLEYYYNVNHVLVNNVLLKGYKINPSLIEYLLDKNDIIKHDLGRSSSIILAIAFIDTNDLNSYKKVLDISDYSPMLLRRAVINFSEYLETRNYNYDSNNTRMIFLITLDSYDNRITLMDILDDVLDHNGTPDEYVHVMAYVIFRVLKDNDELRYISTNNDDINVLILTCSRGLAPKEVMLVLSKYAYPQNMSYYRNNYYPRIVNKLNLFLDDV